MAHAGWLSPTTGLQMLCCCCGCGGGGSDDDGDDSGCSGCYCCGTFWLRPGAAGAPRRRSREKKARMPSLAALVRRLECRIDRHRSPARALGRPRSAHQLARHPRPLSRFPNHRVATRWFGDRARYACMCSLSPTTALHKSHPLHPLHPLHKLHPLHPLHRLDEKCNGRKV